MIYINILLLICASCALKFLLTDPVKFFVCTIYMVLHVLNVRVCALLALLANCDEEILYIDDKI